MNLLVILIVVLLLFGGGSYWGGLHNSVGPYGLGGGLVGVILLLVILRLLGLF